MKNFIISISILLITTFNAKAQTYTGSVSLFTVNSGWNVVPNSTNTTVNFKVSMVREQIKVNDIWVWAPFNMNLKVGIALAPGSAVIEYLSPVYNVTSSNFGANNAIYDATFSFSVSSAKLRDDHHLVLYYNIPNNGSIYYQNYGGIQINNPPPTPQYGINITSVYKAETSLIGVDCGFGPAHAAANHMENGVWRLAYDINYTKTNPAIPDSDIYWEWIVADETNYPSIGKQFLVYPYGGVKNDSHDGQKKVWVEANDYLDEYQSKVTVRAKSRSTGNVYSSDLVFYFSGVNH